MSWDMCRRPKNILKYKRCIKFFLVAQVCVLLTLYYIWPNTEVTPGDVDFIPTRQAVPVTPPHSDALKSVLNRTIGCREAVLFTNNRELARFDLYPLQINGECPFRGKKTIEHQGCVKFNSSAVEYTKRLSNINTESLVQDCVNLCYRTGNSFAGLRDTSECSCYNIAETLRTASKFCNNKCGSKLCGGGAGISIYTTEVGTIPTPSKPDSVPVTPRIAFILSLNGRSVRQVTRLLRLIYSPHHFYLIHVDGRQELMYQTLKNVTIGRNNMRMTTWRLNTIWGGASLLQMLLQAFQDLRASSWQWDFVINLSETDFPIRPVSELTDFLSVRMKNNFLRSHMKHTESFIQRQGLEWTFVECENHMWRINERKLPTGIRYDGGSDWILLNKEFVHYLIDPSSTLVTELLRVFNYTLLPAESFFHTVLQNSRFCSTLNGNNGRVINWKRKQGCKCQQKSQVDWCGCSPNDFVANDKGALAAQVKKGSLFFARKFESVVDIEIINLVEESFLKGTGIDSRFWHNEFASVVDTSVAAFDRYARLLFEIVRRRQGRSDEFRKLQNIHSYFNGNEFKGIVLDLECSAGSMEIFVTRSATVHPDVGKKLAIGSNFDVKELIFRNFLGFYTTTTDIGIMYSKGPYRVRLYAPGSVKEYTATLQASKDVQFASFSALQDKPVLPGEWTLELRLSDSDKNVLFKDTFLRLDAARPAAELLQDAEVLRLVERHYTVQEICGYSPSGGLVDCAEKKWSTKSPDPKSVFQPLI